MLQSSFHLILGVATPTPTPGVGVTELVDYWPAVVRGAWFLAGFLLVVGLGWFVLDPLISRIVRQRNQNNPTIDEAISRYFRLFVGIIAVAIGVGIAGYGGFLADSALVIAAATLAIGVAGQTVIGSIVSGIALVVDPEFNVGNFIQWGDNSGTIQSITLRVTRILTPDGELITVPNELLTGQAISRPYGRGRYRVIDRVGVAYETDTDDAIAHLESAAEELDNIADAPSPKAYVDEFASDAVVITVHYWIVDPRRSDIFAIRSAYAQAVKARFDEAGITISPPSKRDLEGRIEVANAV